MQSSSLLSIALCLWIGLGRLLSFDRSAELLDAKQLDLCRLGTREMAALLVALDQRSHLRLSLGILELLGQSQMGLYGPLHQKSQIF